MILQFKVKNYRSYKDETIFSMEAGASEQKSDNYFEANKSKILKSALIYGANASGKSNLIRALFELQRLILNKPSVDEPLKAYDPFMFDINSKKLPCEFELTFIGPSSCKFIYRLAIDHKAVLEEELDYYPNGKPANIFKRMPFDKNSLVQKGVLGDGFKKKEIKVFPNQLVLSKFGDDEPHEFISQVYLYFKSWFIANATSPNHRERLTKVVNKNFSENKSFRKRLSRLIRFADTQVEDIEVKKVKDSKQAKTSEEEKSPIPKDVYELHGIHSLYDSNIKLDSVVSLAFSEESTGTQTFYTLGGMALLALDNGRVLAVDELDTSLHPFITRMIVEMFQSPIINTKNAQLIFTSHDVTLLDKDLVRRDQIWITEKNEAGSTDLYSLQDFEGIREDTPFEKWYMAGKFGGIPMIKSVESMFEDDEPAT